MTDDGSNRPSTTDLPVLEPADLPDAAAEGCDNGASGNAPTVAGIVLAAGTSSRFGAENKLLTTVEGEPIVRHAAQTLVESVVDPVVVVLGHEAERVRDALAGLPVETVVNEDYDDGQASSLRTGIEAVQRRNDEPEATVVALGDMPFVSPETVDALVVAYAADAGDAIAAALEGVRGYPVLFDERFFEPLTAVDGDVGGREILLESDASVLVDVDDSGVRRDVDVPSDV
ncbi:nucleotidyltransferase family protein [Natrinema sp. 1APR25-10V2]|uniref:nucleotidyltransferase family protein n=1 Tax=Natrinema sp. 1APR25-10V2 TaxID=2951081 RepID=UPI0028752D67|nr:nucleotidyltransferase family protein [Natrinema sp. 1APR25-10V2]MDS0477819.1 nucleotidyltransferase family protein [Natrinema sp. 1APR25-10V2]